MDRKLPRSISARKWLPLGLLIVILVVLVGIVGYYLYIKDYSTTTSTSTSTINVKEQEAESDQTGEKDENSQNADSAKIQDDAAEKTNEQNTEGSQYPEDSNSHSELKPETSIQRDNVEKGDWVIIAGAFNKQDGAEGRVSSFREKNIKSDFIFKYGFYTVLIGSFDSKQEAEMYMELLKSNTSFHELIKSDPDLKGIYVRLW